MDPTRQQAHELIDRMPDSQLSRLVRFLETIIDPVTTALRDAPIDEEPETEKEKREVGAARDWLVQHGGKGIPHHEAMRRLGLD